MNRSVPTHQADAAGCASCLGGCMSFLLKIVAILGALAAAFVVVALLLGVLLDHFHPLPAASAPPTAPPKAMTAEPSPACLVAADMRRDFNRYFEENLKDPKKTGGWPGAAGRQFAYKVTEDELQAAEAQCEAAKRPLPAPSRTSVPR